MIESQPRAGAGNYFHSRAISGFILCLAGQIQVKYDNSKLKKQAFAGRMWPAGRMLPPSHLELDFFNYCDVNRRSVP